MGDYFFGCGVFGLGELYCCVIDDVVEVVFEGWYDFVGLFDDGEFV